GIARRLVKIDDPVIRTAVSDPFVHGKALLFSHFAIVRGSVKRCQGSSVDFQASGVRTLDDLLVPRDDVFGRRSWILEGDSNVVDPFHEYHVRHARLREDVVLETCKRIDSGLK